MAIVLDGTANTVTPLNGALGATTPSTVVATTVVASSTIKGATTISVGNATPSASGAGITFPATQSASTDANTLDDYEEGTFTPTLGGSATYGAQVGNYVKVGKAVTIQLYIAVTSIGSGSTTTISGLPFTSPTQQAAFCSYWGSLATAATTLKPRFEAGTSIAFYGASTAATITNSWTTFGNSTAIYVSGTYFI